MVTYDPKVKRDTSIPLEDQILPEHASLFKEILCERYGFTAATEQHWEVSEKRQAVHVHFLLVRKIQFKYQLKAMYTHPKHKISMLKALSNICKHAPPDFHRNGAFLTWKHRHFQDPNAFEVNPKTGKPWSESMPYFEKDWQTVQHPWRKPSQDVPASPELLSV